MKPPRIIKMTDRELSAAMRPKPVSGYVVAVGRRVCGMVTYAKRGGRWTVHPAGEAQPLARTTATRHEAVAALVAHVMP